MRIDLDLRSLDGVKFVLARRPYHSVGLQLTYAFHWAPGRLPTDWRRRIHRSVDRRLRPSLAPLRYFLPQELTDSGREEGNLGTRIAQARDSSGEWMPEWIESSFGPRMPDQLRPVQDRPRAFLASVLMAADQASALTRSLWPTVGPLLDREERRVAHAISATAKRQLLASLHPTARLAGDRLVSQSVNPGEQVQLMPLNRKVELIPILAGSTGGGFGVGPDMSGIEQIIYPLPGLDRVIAGQPIEAEPDLLGLLLGPIRSQLLRALDQPLTVSQLAQLVGGPLSKITYHCDHLEAAGLIRRERSPRRVQVWRTVRGDQLIHVMS
jgi:hypothetical protein